MSKNTIQFNKPYNFEGTDYKEVDLSGLDNLTTSDLLTVEQQFNAAGNFAVMNELSLGFTMLVAAKASGKPIEFFHRLPAKEGFKVKNEVMGFLNA
ncbi:phage tail assembly protein [Psychrobacillus sp.]|uniref:phage tail assembly protein n=1 Tax=Psychrobacillus sp. TaxID=1871623 RepID=UPI0028BDCB12|nr:phage tail assembly protein [Psychrobacillus sp.]